MKTIHVGSRTHLLLNDIVMIKADISYSHIYMREGRVLLVSTHLLKLERRFLGSMLRVHRSYLLNPNFVKEYTENSALTSTGQICPLSRRLGKNLKLK